MERIIWIPVYVLYKLWIGLVFWLTLIVLYPFFLVFLSRREWYPKAFRLKRWWSRIFQVLLFCPVRVDQGVPLPEPPYIIVSNHSSHLDTVFMYSVIPDYFLFMGKGELLKWPFFRLFFRTMDIPVHRGNDRESWNSLRQAGQAIDRGECIALYPEGTIPPGAPRMKAFKNGAFKLAQEKNIPIVPITWIQNYKILRDPERPFERSLPGLVKVRIHPPVYPEGTSGEDLIALRTHVFRVIESALPNEFQKNYDH